MAVNLSARVGDAADLKLKKIQVRLRQDDPGVLRPACVEAAILAAELDQCAEVHRRTLAATETA